MKIRKDIITVFGWLFLFVGCDKSDLLTKCRTYDGVTVHLTVSASSSGETDPGKMMTKALETFKSRLSRVHGKDSELQSLNQAQKPVEVSEEFYRFLELVAEMEMETGRGWNPRMGELYDLWAFDDEDFQHPGAEKVETARKRCAESRMNFLHGLKIELTNHATLKLDRVGIAWAVDGAADAMLKGGVNSGMVSADGIYRTWGTPGDQQKWSIIFGKSNEDSMSYKVEPEDGGVCVIELDEVSIEMDGKVYAAILSPFTGLPAESCNGVATWNMTALSATILAEYAFAFDREDVFERFSQIDGAGLFYSYQGHFGLTGESNPLMAKWLSAVLP